MTELANQIPGGDPSEAGGDGANGGNQIPDKVDYRTYKKTVDSEKNLKKQNAELLEKVTAFENERKAAEEAKLLEQNQHLQVIEQLKKQNEELNGKLRSVDEERVESRKLTSAMGLLNQKGVQLDPKYIGMIPTEQIEIGADGRPDPTSVAKAVDEFMKEHPRLVTPLPNDLPGTRPGGTVNQLTVEQWKALPYADRMKRFKDVKMPKV